MAPSSYSWALGNDTEDLLEETYACGIVFLMFLCDLEIGTQSLTEPHSSSLCPAPLSQEWFSFPFVCKRPFMLHNASRFHIYETLGPPASCPPFYDQFLTCSSWGWADCFLSSPRLVSVFGMEKGLDVSNIVCVCTYGCVYICEYV